MACGTTVVSYRLVYSDAGICKAIRHQFSASAQVPMLFSRISMVQLHEGVEVEVIAEVMDLPDMPPGDELSSADAYDDLEDHPYECRDIDWLALPVYQICLPIFPKEKSESFMLLVSQSQVTKIVVSHNHRCQLTWYQEVVLEKGVL